MSSVTASRDSGKPRLSKARTTALSGDINNPGLKRNQTTGRTPALASTKAKAKWCSSTSRSTSDNVGGSSFSDTFLDSRRRAPRKAPLPAAARAKPLVRNTSRLGDPLRTPKRSGGLESESSDSAPVVNEVKSPAFARSPRVTSIPDEARVAEAKRVLQEVGVLSSNGNSANFAALSDEVDAGSLSPPSVSNRSLMVGIKEAAPSAPLPATNKAEPSMGDLQDSITMLQKEVAELRSAELRPDPPHVSSNPLRDEVEMNRRAIQDSTPSTNPGASSFSMAGASGNLTSRSAYGPSAEFGNSGLQAVKSKKRTDGRSRKVPLPADLMAGRPGASAGGMAAGQSAILAGGLSKALADDADDGNESDSSASSFGLSCGLPGLSNEVADTITHLSAAETIQASVTVTPLSLKDWLLRPVPTPMDPSLTLYGAAVHNAHVACCEVVIGGLLSAIESGSMEPPAGIPNGTYDFRSRGISDQDALQSVLSNLAEWMKTLIDQNPANAPMDVSRASAEVQSDDAILQDPRAVPLLGVLRSEARRIIGEEEDEARARRAAHLNATDMLHILTTALVPSFRQLMSRSVEPEPIPEEPQSVPDASPNGVPTLGTSKSSSSLFSIPAGSLEKTASMAEPLQDASSAAEEQSAAQIAATGVRPDNPCDSGLYGAESIAVDASPEPVDMVDSVDAVDAMHPVDASPEPAAPATPAEVQKEEEEPCAEQQERLSVKPLAALSIMDMKAARELESSTGGITGGIEDCGPEGSARSGSPMSHAGSINADALTDALRKLMTAGAGEGEEGLEEVDVVDMLRQLAAERVAAKKRGSETGNGAASVHDSPNRALADAESNSEFTAPSSASDATSQTRSSAIDGDASAAVSAKDQKEQQKEQQRSEQETEHLQAAELEKLLKHPAVLQMLEQMASSKMGGISPEQLQMQQQLAARNVAQERERAMRYEMQIARQQQQQRMMMNTFVNMNMMQSQMTNAMFSSMMSPQQQQQPKGASAMMGQPVPSMMGPVGSMMPAGSVMPGMMPSPSAMGARMPAKPRMQTPINRYASSISMPYLQVGGQTPLPQNAPAPAANAKATPASSSNTDASSSIATPLQSTPNLPTTPSPQPKSSGSRGSLPTTSPQPVSSSGTSASGSVKNSDSESRSQPIPQAQTTPQTTPVLQPSSSSSQPRQGSSGSHSQKLPGVSSRSSQNMHKPHPMQSRSMMSPQSGGGPMMPGMNGMMPQHPMGGIGGYPQHHPKSASYMGGMGGSMMGAPMGGMGGNSAPLNGMMPQQAGSFMGGMRSNSFMGGNAPMLNGMMPQQGSFMGGMQPGGMPMGMHPGMHGGMPVQRSASMPHPQNQMSRQHSTGGSSGHSHSNGGHSRSHRQRNHSHPVHGMLPYPQNAGHHQPVPGTNPYSSGVPTPVSIPESDSSSKSRSSARVSSTNHAHDTSQRLTSANGSFQPRPGSNGNLMSPNGKMFPAHQGSVPLEPPPMHGEISGSIDGSTSFMFDSANSGQLSAPLSGSGSARNAAAPSSGSKSQSQRQYKHLGARSGRRPGPKLEATPEGEEESDSQVLG